MISLRASAVPYRSNSDALSPFSWFLTKREVTECRAHWSLRTKNKCKSRHGSNKKAEQ
jgi:hypothetical protein